MRRRRHDKRQVMRRQIESLIAHIKTVVGNDRKSTLKAAKLEQELEKMRRDRDRDLESAAESSPLTQRLNSFKIGSIRHITAFRLCSTRGFIAA